MQRSLRMLAGLLALCLALAPAYAASLLPLLGVGGSATVPFSITYISNNSSAVAGSSFAFNAQNVGTADTTRITGLGFVYHLSAGTGNVISSVTVNGSNATQAASSPANNTLAESSEIWTIANPSGTTANISVTTSASLSRILVCVFSVVGTGASTVSPGANNISNVSVTTLTQTLSIPAGGGAIAISDIHSATPGTITPTNLTNDVSFAQGSSTAVCGHNTSSSGSTSMGQSWVSSTDGTLSLAAFNP